MCRVAVVVVINFPPGKKRERGSEREREREDKMWKKAVMRDEIKVHFFI